MKTIYKNGAVYTGKLPLVEAFAVEDGKFVFAGSSAEADALAAAGDKVVDLGGKFVCSGFNDSHMHLLNYGSSLLKAQLAAHTESLEDMLACLIAILLFYPSISIFFILPSLLHCLRYFYFLTFTHNLSFIIIKLTVMGIF